MTFMPENPPGSKKPAGVSEQYPEGMRKKPAGDIKKVESKKGDIKKVESKKGDIKKATSKTAIKKSKYPKYKPPKFKFVKSPVPKIPKGVYSKMVTRSALGPLGALLAGAEAAGILLDLGIGGTSGKVGKAAALGGEEGAYNAWRADTLEKTGETMPSYEEYLEKKSRLSSQREESIDKLWDEDDQGNLTRKEE